MTRKFLPLVLLTLLFAGLALAQAQPAAPTNTSAPATGTSNGTQVGVIDIQQAIGASNEGQRDFGALEKKFEPKRTELTSLQTEIENLKKQLSAQSDKLNDETRGNLVKQIDTKQKSFQRQMEDAQADFQAQQNEILNRIGQKMMETAVKYAQAHQIGVIIDASSPQSGVLWANEGMNITKPVVDAYNVTSGVPAPTPSAASAAPKPSTGAVTPKPVTPKPATTTTPPKKPS
jgi:Skp family chaperone for outer membrane proteins